MKLIFNNSEVARDAVSVTSTGSSISNTAFEKKMNEQMSKGIPLSVVFDSALTNSNVPEANANTIPTNETSVNKSPSTKINTA